MFQKIISTVLITAGFCLLIGGYIGMIGGQREIETSFQSAQAVVQHQVQKDSSFAPQAGETIGLLHIPKLKAELPIVKEQQQMIWQKVLDIIRRAISLMSKDKLCYLDIVIPYLYEQESL